MKLDRFPSLIEVAILLYCGWMASDLPHSWISTPAVRYEWVAFVIWASTCLCYMVFMPKGSTPLFLGLAVVCSLVGSIGSLHILNHLGLALAIAGMLPFSGPQVVWLASFVSWTPALGWFAKLLSPPQEFTLQVLIAIIGSLWLEYTVITHKKEQT
jgi:hypothetical protein